MHGVTFFRAAVITTCLSVRPVICNYPVVVFSYDQPSADSMQYTCWSPAEVRDSAVHSIWSCLYSCRDIYRGLWNTLLEDKNTGRSYPIQNCLGTDMEIDKIVNKHKVGLIRWCLCASSAHTVRLTLPTLSLSVSDIHIHGSFNYSNMHICVFTRT